MKLSIALRLYYLSGGTWPLGFIFFISGGDFVIELASWCRFLVQDFVQCFLNRVSCFEFVKRFSQLFKFVSLNENP